MELVKEQSSMTMMNARLRGLSQLTAGHQRERTSPLNRLTSPRERKHNRQSDVTPRRARKRRSAPSDRDKLTPQQVSTHLLVVPSSEQNILIKTDQILIINN